MFRLSLTDPGSAPNIAQQDVKNLHQKATPATVVILRIYYAATALFLILDYALGINVRLASLEAWPGWRALYYAICFGCLALIVWRPGLTTLVTTVESLVTLCMLIMSMGYRVMTASVIALESGAGFVTAEEIINFLLVGGAAWIGWIRGSQALQKAFRKR